MTGELIPARPGIYVMPLAEYLADPCVTPSFSSSAAVSICTRSPMHAWHEHPRLNPNAANYDGNHATDLGAAAHAMLLDRDESSIERIDAEDYRTKVARELRDDARAKGRVPLLEKHYEAAKRIVAASRAALAGTELAWVYGSAYCEKSVLWQDYQEAWCRARPDAFDLDAGIVVNYKTTATNAEPAAFGHGYLLRGGYHIQAYHHLRGMAAVTGKALKFVWVVQETEPPYGTSLIGMAPSLQSLAQAQWEHAFGIWRECLATNHWPGYPSKVAWIDAPQWTVSNWCNRPDVTLDAMEVVGGFVR